MPQSMQKIAGHLPGACHLIKLALLTLTFFLEYDLKNTTTAMGTTCNTVFRNVFYKTNTVLRKDILRNDTFQDKYSEMDSAMSNCCCFLLRLLILVQKTAHARGAVREPRGLATECCLTLAGHLFLKRFLDLFLLSKSMCLG